MKTVIVFDSVGDEVVFFIVEKNWAHLHGVFINGSNSEELMQELSDLIYDSEGEYKHLVATRRAVKDAITNGAELIVCGFIN